MTKISAKEAKGIVNDSLIRNCNFTEYFSNITSPRTCHPLRADGTQQLQDHLTRVQQAHEPREPPPIIPDSDASPPSLTLPLHPPSLPTPPNQPLPQPPTIIMTSKTELKGKQTNRVQW